MCCETFAGVLSFSTRASLLFKTNRLLSSSILHLSRLILFFFLYTTVGNITERLVCSSRPLESSLAKDRDNNAWPTAELRAGLEVVGKKTRHYVRFALFFFLDSRTHHISTLCFEMKNSTRQFLSFLISRQRIILKQSCDKAAAAAMV